MCWPARQAANPPAPTTAPATRQVESQDPWGKRRKDVLAGGAQGTCHFVWFFVSVLILIVDCLFVCLFVCCLFVCFFV